MITRRRNPPRNCLDVRDQVQVKVLRRRLKISNEQLSSIVRTAGNSLTAINKEAGQRRLSLPGAARQPVETIAVTQIAEAVSAEVVSANAD